VRAIPRLSGDELLVAGDFAAPVDRREQLEAALASLAEVGQGLPLALNLESALWRSGHQLSERGRMRSPPDLLIEALRRCDVRLVSLANNHTGDSGPEGLYALRAVLQGELGLQLDVDELDRIAVSRVRLATAGTLAVVGAVWSGTGRTADRVPHFWQPAAICRLVARERARSDFVIAYLHWGYEFEPYPLPAQRAWARALVDAGADVVVGAHPHVPQGFERYRERLIAYSLGSFCMPRTDTIEYFPEEAGRGLLLELRFASAGRIEFSFAGIEGVDLATPPRRTDVAARLDELSAPLRQDLVDYRRWYRGQRTRWYLPAFDGGRLDPVRARALSMVDTANRWSGRLRVGGLARRVVGRAALGAGGSRGSGRPDGR